MTNNEKDEIKDRIARVVYENIFGDAHPTLLCQPHELVERLMEIILEYPTWETKKI